MKKRQGPLLGVPLSEVSVKRELNELKVTL